MKITVWRRLGEDSRFHHNHIEDGWKWRAFPIGKIVEQTRNWSRGEWVYVHTYLINGIVQ